MSRGGLRALRGVLAVGLMLLAGGCAQHDMVVVLPEEDGHVGAVVLHGADGSSVVLDKAYAAGQANGGHAERTAADGDSVRRTFGGALAALPPAPRTFVLNFPEDGIHITPRSKPVFEAVAAEIASRKVPDVVVIGHTDTMGSMADNDKLALDRAKAVRDMLVQRGVARQAITVAGRGEREPLIPTPDETPEPRNRRAEITIR